MLGTPTGGTLRNQDPCNINVLTPYFTSHVLKCKVVSKTNLITYSNAKGKLKFLLCTSSNNFSILGEGHFFKFEVCDDTGSLQIAAFNDQCDILYPSIEKGLCLLISRLKIAIANKRYTSNEYEATVQSNTIIEVIADQDNSIGEPAVAYHFKYLSQLAEMPDQARVDVIGIITSVGESVEFTSKKTNKPMTRREVHLADKSMAESRLTFWNEAALNFTSQVGDVLAVKGARINDFQGKCLSCFSDSIVAVNPNLAEVHELRTWWDEGAKNQEFKRLYNQTPNINGGASSSTNTYVSKIIGANLNPKDKQRYFSFIGRVIGNNAINRQFYKACKECNKKLLDDNEGGTLKCPKCHVPTTEHLQKMMLSLNVADATGALWVTIFGDSVQKLLGKSESELTEIYNTGEEHYAELLNDLRFKLFNFRIGARLEEYNDQIRLRCNAYSITEMSPAEEQDKLIHLINVLKNQLVA